MLFFIWIPGSFNLVQGRSFDFTPFDSAHDKQGRGGDLVLTIGWDGAKMGQKGGQKRKVAVENVRYKCIKRVLTV